MNSDIHDFHKMTLNERRDTVRKLRSLSDEDMEIMKNNTDIKDLENMIENVISTMEIPVGIATNFKINNKDYLIPMCIEEPSVVAACSHGAKIARVSGGFKAYSMESLMRGELQLYDVPDRDSAIISIFQNKQKILDMANTRSKTLSSMKAGAMDIEISAIKDYIVLYLIINVKDAMGANVINTMLEFIAPFIEDITGGKINLRIMSNLTTERISYAHAKFKKELIGGEKIVNRIIMASNLAKQDIYRATTHNKGIMNGIDAVILATLNDFRAEEANAHAYASINNYHSLTDYYSDENGDLIGSIKIPISTGIVGGATRTSKKASLSLKILNISSSQEMADVLACVGLAQNFAAMRALSNEGIQKGHMKLHARNIAISAGATDKNVNAIVEKMMEKNTINYSAAKELLVKYNGDNNGKF